jgi:hypothetical protein
MESWTWTREYGNMAGYIGFQRRCPNKQQILCRTGASNLEKQWGIICKRKKTIISTKLSVRSPQIPFSHFTHKRPQEPKTQKCSSDTLERQA